MKISAAKLKDATFAARCKKNAAIDFLVCLSADRKARGFSLLFIVALFKRHCQGQKGKRETRTLLGHEMDETATTMANRLCCGSGSQFFSGEEEEGQWKL